jgi:hypothetical protein
MNLLHALRRDRTLPRWLSPAPWMRTTAKALWAVFSCLFGMGLAAVAPFAPFGGLLLVLVGAAIAMDGAPKVHFDLYAIEGIGARLYGAAWLLAGLALLARHWL